MIVKIIACIYIILAVLAAAPCAYAHHTPMLPQRDYQRELASFPMREYIFIATPEQAPFHINQYTFFATILDRGWAGNSRLIDAVFYAHDAKHLPYEKNIHITLTNSNGKTLYDGEVAPDSQNTCRLRLALAAPEKCRAVVKFRDAGWDYRAEFDLQMGSPGINYAILGACILPVLAALAAALVAKISGAGN